MESDSPTLRKHIDSPLLLEYTCDTICEARTSIALGARMNRNIAFAIIFLAALCVGCRHSETTREESPPPSASWFNPSHQALTDAVTAGFQGREPEGFKIYQNDDPTFTKCLHKVSAVIVFSPLSAAQRFGYDRRKEFGSAPTLGDVASYGNSASISVYYGASSPDDQASIAVSVGDTLYKPRKTGMSNSEAISCESETIPPAWSLTIYTVFEGQNALPASGKGRVIVRRNGMEDANFDIDFDSIPSSVSTPQ